MIPARELRIGNYTIAPNGEYVAIESTGIHAIVNGWLEVNPIPLTPELLEKCGFVKDDDDITLTLNVELDLRYDTYNKSVTLWAHFDYAVISIKHLHQLQNLYFALTGNELEINL